MHKITAAITTYNLEPMIGRCLDELMAQTFQDFDVLIVDDCSTDSTAEAVRQYMEAWPGRIRAVFLDENTGSPARTRNAALDSGMIEGEYVVFLDGDDCAEPRFLEALYNRAVKTGADITVCAYDRVERDTMHVLCTEMQGFPELVSIPGDSGILPFINGSLWNKLIKTSLITDTRLPDFKVGEDMCFLYRLYSRCKAIAFIDEVLIHYMVRKDSVISNTQTQAIQAFAGGLLLIYRDDFWQAHKAAIMLTVFIHIGISMAMRAYDNPGINLRAHLKWAYRYLSDGYGMFSGRRHPFPRSIKNHGFKGHMIIVCWLLYRIRCFSLFIYLYKFVTRLFSIDIKF